MMKVFLRDLRFNAERGIYKEEHLTGTALAVDLEVSFEENGQIENENQTISYVDLFELVKAEVMGNGGLLETLAMDISKKIKLQFPQVWEINITISKIQPPILNFQGQAGIHFHQIFE